VKLNTFDGGKSTRVNPTLLGLNEAVCMVNVDNTDLTLTSCCGLREVEGVTVSGYFYNYKNIWLSSTSERSYVEYKGVLYFTEANSKPKKNDGQRELTLGIEAPTNKLVATQVTPVGTEKISDVATVVQYVYTYYNAQDGVESAPSPISDELNLAANTVVDVNGLELSEDVQVDRIRLYRVGAGSTVFTLVEELPHFATTIRDDTPTLSLEGDLLESVDNQPPPLGLQYLVEAYGTLFAALGDKLYFTKPGQPDAWPSLYYLDLPYTITGLLVVSNGILVFSKNATHVLLGVNKESFSIEDVSDEQGCISHLSCKKCKNIPFWVSSDGICTYATGIVSLVSMEKLGKLNLSVVNAVVYNEQYFLLLANGSLLCMDLRFVPNFRDFKFDLMVDNVHKFDNQLYARCANKLYKLFYSGLEKFHYKSPKLTEGDHSVVKMYNNIYMRSCGDFEVKVFIDDNIVVEQMFTGDAIHDIMPNMEDQRGSNIQFDITGIGTVYEVEYKALGRNNGR